MKIKYTTEDGLNTIKSNIRIIYKKVFQDKDETIADLLENGSFIRDSSLQIDDFRLDMSQPKGKESLTDSENIQRVYSHMKFLSDSQASDERIWAAYTFFEFYEYMLYRWPPRNVKDLENRYLFGYSIQRSLYRNGVARLWWIGRFTYDSSRTDPFELTKFLCKDQDYIESICGRNIFNNPIIGKAAITALYDSEKAGIKIDRSIVREIGKYINLLSGTYLLDALEFDDIYNKVSKKIGLV